jgi:capsular exopolysaccharide synthesis family protein
MSRVFEALKRVGEEKESSERFGSRHEPAGDKTPAQEGLLPGWDSSVDHPSLTVPSQIYNGRKRWRERIEEFLFGWNLRRFKTHPLVALEKGSPAAEQYKILREQVKKLCSEPGARFLAVTSPVKGDGKTTVAANLAAAIALHYEEQVLLIDADLRNPSIHSYFGVKPTPGLADYLSSNSSTDLMSYVQDTFVRGVRILPAGKPSLLSSELLAKEKMRNLIKEIPSKLPGHQVIVDTPPVLTTPDPLVLARHVDGIIVVIRSRKTPRDCLLKTITSLGSNKVLGVILNDAELGMASRHYYRKRS